MDSLPKYRRPPIIEVVCGVQFAPLQDLSAALVGSFWHRFRDEYSKTKSVSPLGHLVESHSPPTEPRQVQVEITDTPPLPRTWFIHEDKNWLIQLQADRLLHNWRRVNESDKYPHFESVFLRFQKAWESFREFISDEKLAACQVDQLELTYVNHVPQGDGWHCESDIGAVFPGLKLGQLGFLPAPESLGWQSAFLLPDNQGRLHVSIRQVVRRKDGKPVLLCELTARGMPSSSDDTALDAWFQMAREWIVRGFADLTSTTIQRETWERYQ